ncbi:MAG: tetratricopeptide repeat protein [Kofleriaceae bacterium]
MKLARPRVIATLVAIGLAASVTPALAQSAEAEVLFRDGRKLIKAGKLAAGCAKLEASERLESSVGALLNLGDCREKLGRLASAWSAFRKATAMAKRSGGDTKRELEASRRASQLEPRLPNLVIQVTAQIAGLVVKRDGELVDPALWSTAVPVDPDRYEIVAEAPGYVTWRTEVAIDNRSKRKLVSIPQLQRAPTPSEPRVEAPVARPLVQSPTVIAPAARMVGREPGAWTTTRKVSAVLAAAGLGAIGGGVYFGMRSKDLEDQANERCPTVLCVDAEAVRLNDRAQDNALRANILYAAGGASVVVATVMWFVGKPDSETVVSPSVGSDRTGVSLMGRF